MTTRRSFLTMLGLSPVVAAVPAVAATSEKKVVIRADATEFAKRVPIGSRMVWYNDGSFELISDEKVLIRTRSREDK